MQETSPRANRAALLTLAACLIIPSSGVVARYGSVSGLIVYAGIVCLVLLAGARWGRPWILRHLSCRRAAWVAFALLLIVTLAVALVYPIANSGTLGGGSDRDEALNLGVRSLLKGAYPYHQTTYLDNPISPMPGAFLLAAPFVVLFGSSAYQNLLWLAVFCLVVQRYVLADRRESLLLALVVLGLSPAIWQELATGGDLLANGLYVAAFAVLMLGVHCQEQAKGWQRIAADVLLGVGLASRANYLLILLPLAVYLGLNRGWPHAVRHLALTVSVFASLVVPFYLYDPVAFWPAHTTVEVDRFNRLVPHAGAIIVGVTVLAAFAAAFFMLRQGKRPALAGFFYACAMPQAAPVLLGLAAYVYVGMLANAYAGFGLNFTFFGVLAAAVLLSAARGPQR